MQLSTNPDFELVRKLECAEEEAWQDMYRAIPPDFAARMGLSWQSWPECSLFMCQTIPFIHFNAVMAFGLKQNASPALLEQIIAAYAAQGIKQFWLHLTGFEQPEQLIPFLQARGFAESSRWERVYRAPQVLPETEPGSRNFVVERVTELNAVSWAGFIDKIYHLPNSPWLLELVGRPGWSHYLLSENEQILAARSLYRHENSAWLGIDAPIPGLMTGDFEPDARLCETMVREGLAAGIQDFFADIEAPSARRDSPAYAHFARLGFAPVYHRINYVSGPA